MSQSGRGSPFVTSTDGINNVIVWVVGAEGDQRLHGYNGDTGAVIYGGGGANELMTGHPQVQYRHRGSWSHLHRHRQQGLCFYPAVGSHVRPRSVDSVPRGGQNSGPTQRQGSGRVYKVLSIGHRISYGVCSILRTDSGAR